MCVLIVHWRQVPGYPIVVGANRDESYERPSAPPRHLDDGRTFAPIDLRAGGTWLGVNRDGLFAAITNRSLEPLDPTRRSRGELCQLALDATSATDAAAAVAGAVEAEPRNGFNLIVLDSTRAFVLSGGTGVRTTPLTRPGTHVLTNRHELDVFDLGDLTPPADIDAALAALETWSRDHEARDNYRICKHGQRGGTVSSALIALGGGPTHPHRFRFAAGPPCEHAFETLDAQLTPWTRELRP